MNKPLERVRSMTQELALNQAIQLSQRKATMMKHVTLDTLDTVVSVSKLLSIHRHKASYFVIHSGR